MRYGPTGMLHGRCCTSASRDCILLPLAPHLWLLFLCCHCWWYNVGILDEGGDSEEMWLYAHLTGDFGAALLLLFSAGGGLCNHTA